MCHYVGFSQIGSQFINFVYTVATAYIIITDYSICFLLLGHCLCKLLLLCFQDTTGAQTACCLHLHLSTMATIIIIRCGHHRNSRLIDINSNITVNAGYKQLTWKDHWAKLLWFSRVHEFSMNVT